MLSRIIPDDMRINTPSRLVGIDYSTERTYRIFGCDLIQEVGILLRLPQVTIATAETLLQRFYYRKSLLDFDVHIVALASIFLAGKVEETIQQMRDIISAMYYCKCVRQNKLPATDIVVGGELYNHWKNELIRTERFILKELGFNVYGLADLPHKYILYYIKALEGTDELAQHAWNYLNDSLRIPLHAKYSAQSIACTAIYMAACDTGFRLPKTTPWYSVFSTTLSELEAIREEILELYTIERPLWLPSLKPEKIVALQKLQSGSVSSHEAQDCRILCDLEVDEKL